MNRKNLVAISTFLVTFLATSMAFAQDGAAGGGGGANAIAAALAIGIAAFGGALGQGRAATAALEGIARNPGSADKVFTPFILALALIESLVIYAFVIAFLVKGY